MNAKLKFTEPVPGVDICQNDLALFAEFVLDVLQVNRKCRLTTDTIRAHALMQAAFNIGFLCDQMQDSKKEAGTFENTLRQQQAILELAGECAETLATLAALPSMANPNGRSPNDEASNG